MNQDNILIKLENTLTQAYKLLVDQKDLQVLPILNQYRDAISGCDEVTKDKYYRFTAFEYLRERNFIEAENYIQKLRERESLDVYYIMTTINFHLREFEKAISNGNKYIEHHNESVDNNVQITKTDKYKNNILNIVGQSLMMLRRYDEADELFNNAVQVDTMQPQTYINMVRLAEHLKDKETANEILETALQKCPDSIELKILAGISKKYQDNSCSHT